MSTTELAELSEEEKNELRKYGQRFLTWLQKNKGRQNIRRHRNHEQYLKEELSEKRLQNVTEKDLVKIFSNLWVYRAWRNKIWIIEKIIKKNGFLNLKNEFIKLLYGSDDFQKRYDLFQNNISGLKISTLSEILCMVFPDTYCLWNAKTKRVLQFLNFALREKFYQEPIISGERYLECIHFMKIIRHELTHYGVNDFVDLDLFYWKIYQYDFIKSLTSKDTVSLDDYQRLEKNSIWIVRPGLKKGSGYNNESVNYKMITVGWNELSDLTFLRYKYFLRRHPEVSSWDIPGELSPNISQLCKFIRDIKLDDVVIVPVVTEHINTVDIGMVTQDYGYHEINNMKSIMKVLWVSKDVPLDNFSSY